MAGVSTVLKAVVLFFALAALSSCSNTYYGAMEKVGVHKRDIMVDRVESARNAQEDAQEHISKHRAATQNLADFSQEFDRIHHRSPWVGSFLIEEE